jgi:phosphohistidine phosphatase
MKTIYLIRHAKSSWDNPALSDFNRTLNERGKANAPLMGKKLVEEDAVIDCFISSPAKRTTETSLSIANEMNYPSKKIIFDERIYESSLIDLIKVANEIPNQFNNVALIGHNPSISQLFNYLAGEDLHHFPTCGIGKVELEIDQWSEIVKGIGRKIFFIYPKMF